jgi:hypothetical protein
MRAVHRPDFAIVKTASMFRCTHGRAHCSRRDSCGPGAGSAKGGQTPRNPRVPERRVSVRHRLHCEPVRRMARTVVDVGIALGRAARRQMKPGGNEHSDPVEMRPPSAPLASGRPRTSCPRAASSRPIVASPSNPRAPPGEDLNADQADRRPFPLRPSATAARSNATDRSVRRRTNSSARSSQRRYNVAAGYIAFKPSGYAGQYIEIKAPPRPLR